MQPGDDLGSSLTPGGSLNPVFKPCNCTIEAALTAAANSRASDVMQRRCVQWGEDKRRQCTMLPE